MEGVVGEFLKIPTIPTKNERAPKQSAPKNSPITTEVEKTRSKEDTSALQSIRIVTNITLTLMLAPRKRSNSHTKKLRRESISLGQKRWVLPRYVPWYVYRTLNNSFQIIPFLNAIGSTPNAQKQNYFAKPKFMYTA